MPGRTRCRFLKSNGERCGTTFGISPEGYCWHHDPQREEERRIARAKGGKHAAKGRRPWAADEDVPGGGPQTAQEAKEWASWLVSATARGLISDGVSQRVSTAINTFIRAHNAADMEREIRSLKSKIKELEDGPK
jgi:hypothetical protein